MSDGNKDVCPSRFKFLFSFIQLMGKMAKIISGSAPFSWDPTVSEIQDPPLPVAPPVPVLFQCTMNRS